MLSNSHLNSGLRQIDDGGYLLSLEDVGIPDLFEHRLQDFDLMLRKGSPLSPLLDWKK